MIVQIAKKIFGKIGLCSIMALISANVFAAETRDSNTVYYTELTCNPEKDLFEMYPRSITKKALAKKTDDISTALKNRQYGVFLNGKLVGGKVFKDTCRLKNEVSVEVDVDYGRPWIKDIYRKDLPKKYDVFFRPYPDTPLPDGLAFSTGEVLIRKNHKVIAAISNNLTYDSNNIHHKHFTKYDIVYTKNIINVVLTHPKNTKIYNLNELKNKPLLLKAVYLNVY